MLTYDARMTFLQIFLFNNQLQKYGKQFQDSLMLIEKTSNDYHLKAMNIKLDIWLDLQRLCNRI